MTVSSKKLAWESNAEMKMSVKAEAIWVRKIASRWFLLGSDEVTVSSGKARMATCWVRVMPKNWTPIGPPLRSMK
jgi:hypothetical protein